MADPDLVEVGPVDSQVVEFPAGQEHFTEERADEIGRHPMTHRMC